MQVPDSISTTVATQVAAVLDELAARFGATGAYLWEALVQYALFEAIGTVVVVFIAGLASLAGFIYCLRASIKATTVGSTDFYEILTVISAVVLLLTALTALVSGPNLLATIVSPEAAVIKDLLP